MLRQIKSVYKKHIQMKNINKTHINKKKFANRIRGFSLLEIMVALIVASIALVGLIQGLSQYANSIIYLRDKLNAQTIAVSELTRKSLDTAYIIPEFIEVGGDRFELISNEEDYFFRNLEDMKKITLTVYDEDQRELLRVSTITPQQ